jgi:hypothetical protein
VLWDTVRKAGAISSMTPPSREGKAIEKLTRCKFSFCKGARLPRRPATLQLELADSHRHRWLRRQCRRDYRRSSGRHQGEHDRAKNEKLTHECPRPLNACVPVPLQSVTVITVAPHKSGHWPFRSISNEKTVVPVTPPCERA